MAANQVAVLRETLAAHRAMLTGALASNSDLDIDRALQVHAGLAGMLSSWDDFTADEQRKILATMEYLINPDDDGRTLNDLHDPDGFADDLERFVQLQAELGYV